MMLKCDGLLFVEGFTSEKVPTRISWVGVIFQILDGLDVFFWGDLFYGFDPMG